MKFSFFGFVALAMLSMPLLAQETVLKADNNAATVVQGVDLEMAKMLIAGKWADYGNQLAEDFVRTTASGATEHKENAWAEFRPGKNKLLDMIPEEVHVVAYGDSAIVTGHLTILVRQNGKVITCFSRFTDMFVQRGGRWFLLASQATPVSK